jgi:DNA-directed RNA polymerase subunit L
MSASDRLVKNLEIKELVPNFDIDVFRKYSTQLKKLWTDRKMYEISFDLIGVTDKIANAIRRTALTELDVKALTFDVSQIQTNVNFLIANELLDRIQFIPIKQDTPLDTVFSVSAVNNGGDREVLYSSSIVSAGSGGKNWIPQKFRLAELRPGEYLHIPNITVVSGKGCDNSMFSMTSDYCFNNLDYMDVAMINIKGNRLDKRVSVSEVANRIKELGLSPKKMSNEALAFKKVLVIPNRDYKKLISDEEQSKINLAKYDFVLVNPSNQDDNNWISERSSLVESSSEFRLKFYITDRIDPKLLLPMICDNMIGRLQTILDGMKTNSGIVSIRVDPVNIKHEQETITVNMWKMRLTGETHTIGHLIVKHLVMLDPDLPFARPHMDHPQDTNVTIQIIHSDPEKICRTVITDSIKTFTQIRDESTSS